MKIKCQKCENTTEAKKGQIYYYCGCDTNKHKKFRCKICKYLTLSYRTDGICDVCQGIANKQEEYIAHHLKEIEHEKKEMEKIMLSDLSLLHTRLF